MEQNNWKDIPGGYVRIHHVILEDLCSLRFAGNEINSRQQRIVLLIIDQLFGFSFPRPTSISEIAQKTGIHKDNCYREVKQLCKKNILIKVDDYYHLNINYYTDSEKLSTDSNCQIDSSAGGGTVNLTVNNCQIDSNELSNRQLTQYNRISIEEKKKSNSGFAVVGLCVSFDLFWEAYPRHDQRKRAEIVFAERKFTEQEFAIMMSWLETEHAIREKRKRTGGFKQAWPLAENFLAHERWHDAHSAVTEKGNEEWQPNPLKPCSVQTCLNNGRYTTLFRCILCDEHFEALHYVNKSTIKSIRDCSDEISSELQPTYRVGYENGSNRLKTLREILQQVNSSKRHLDSS